MPELPEIETIKLALEKKIVGLILQKIEILSPKSFLGDSKEAEGQKVIKIWRRGKVLGIDLAPVILNPKGEVSPTNVGLASARDSSLIARNDNAITLLFHLKMSGQLIWKGESGKGEGERFVGGHPTQDMLGEMPNAHTRVIFTFEGLESSDKSLGKKYKKSGLSTLAIPIIIGDPVRMEFVGTSHLYFNDQRKFGWVKIIENGQLTMDNSLKNLGPEPLEKDFTWEILKQNLLRHKKMPVKVAVMDQSLVAGVGNIYSNEACFLAKIDPKAKVAELTDKQFQALHQGIIKSLQEGIKHKGSTRAHFIDPEGNKGYFLDYAYVYGRDKLLCKVCGTGIKKVALGGRGTYFCPNCQS